MSINKIACKVGMVVGIVIMIIGISLAAKKENLFDARSANTVIYDTGYASFGGDFYSFVNNNAADAASNIKAVGDSIENSANLIVRGLGILLICFGMFDICVFWALNGRKQNPAPDSGSFETTEKASFVAAEPVPDKGAITDTAATENKATEEQANKDPVTEAKIPE